MIPAAALLAAAALAPAAPAGAGATRPLVSVSASPERVVLAGSSRTTVALTNFGTRPVVVAVAPAGLAVDPRGRPRIARTARSRRAAAWLRLRPARLTLPPGRRRLLDVRSRVPARAAAGDHHALILLQTRPAARGGVAVRLRLGVRVRVRVPGRLVRRLAVRSLSARGRRLTLRLANTGNVALRLPRGGATIVLLRRGRAAARLRLGPREVLPGDPALLTAAAPRGLKGRVLARVELRPVGGPRVVRGYRLRL